MTKQIFRSDLHTPIKIIFKEHPVGSPDCSYSLPDRIVPGGIFSSSCPTPLFLHYLPEGTETYLASGLSGLCLPRTKIKIADILLLLLHSGPLFPGFQDSPDTRGETPFRQLRRTDPVLLPLLFSCLFVKDRQSNRKMRIRNMLGLNNLFHLFYLIRMLFCNIVIFMNIRS